MKVAFPEYHTHIKYKSSIDWKIKKLIKVVKALQLEKIRILDIGCSANPVIFKIKDTEIKKQIDFVGIDYNIETIKQLREKGLSVLHSDISNLSAEDLKLLGKYDIIWASHILEHLSVEKQIEALKNISKLSKRGTYLFIFAPTPYHWYFWDDFTHIRPMTHGSVSDLIRNFGFKVLEARYSLTRKFSDKLQKWLRLPPLRFFLWEVYVIGLFRGNNNHQCAE